MVHPLVHQADRPLQLPQVRDGVFREHGQPEAGQQFRDGVVDLGVVVVGAPGQHDAVRAGGLHPSERFRAGRADVALEGLVFLPCGFHGGVHLGLRGSRHARAHEFGMRFHQLHVQALLQVLLLVVGQPRVQERHAGRAQLVDVQAQRFGVAGHDGAVEVVARPFVLLALPLAAREPDEVRVLVQQVHDVAMGQFGRVAHAFAGHGLDARLVGLLRGRVGQHHAEAQLREEREPEGVVLVQVERPRDAHRSTRRFLNRQRFVAEQALALVLVQVRHVLRFVERACALFAAVARDEAAVLARGRVHAEVVHGQKAAVRTSFATHGLVRGGKRLYLLERQKRRRGVRSGRAGLLDLLEAAAHFVPIAIAREQRGTVGAHVAGDVRAHGLHFGELLERA